MHPWFPKRNQVQAGVCRNRRLLVRYESSCEEINETLFVRNYGSETDLNADSSCRSEERLTHFEKTGITRLCSLTTLKLHPLRRSKLAIGLLILSRSLVRQIQYFQEPFGISGLQIHSLSVRPVLMIKRLCLVLGVLVRGPVNSAGKNKAHNGQTTKLLSNEQGLKGAAPSSQGRMQNKAGSRGKFCIPDRKVTVGAARNGPIPAAMKKTTGLQPSLQSKRQHLPSQGQKLQPASQSQRPQSSGHHQVRKHASSAQGQRSGQNGSPEPHGRAKPAQRQLAPSSILKVTF
jgi:hypothetical protein